MKQLKDILHKVNVIRILGEVSVKVNTIETNSKDAIENTVFVAIKGAAFDGHQFIEDAIEKGAIAVVCEELPDNIVKDIVYVQVDNARKALAFMAANFYDNPSEKLKLVGITGTNGKTTVATILYTLFKELGFVSGLISTIKVCFGEKIIRANLTTPSPLQIQKYLHDMAKQEVTHCFMEVSSHGIVQDRILALNFAGGVFTNLSHDHLDYHKTFADYRNAKKIFLDQLPKTAFALTNADDKNGNFMLQNTRAKKYKYALKTMADFKVKILEKHFRGTLLKIEGREFWTKLVGNFNAYNILCVFAVASMLGIEHLEILKGISRLENVEGRFQCRVSESGVTAIIDYAHTPDALENVLLTINEVRQGKGKLLTVVGCGGNRDTFKRPLMAKIALDLSDVLILTSDNPRDENPESIIKDMENGVLSTENATMLKVLDREEAIKKSCEMATKNDVILVAGKGHENYQEVKGKQIPFSDYEVLDKYLQA